MCSVGRICYHKLFINLAFIFRQMGLSSFMAIVRVVLITLCQTKWSKAYKITQKGFLQTYNSRGLKIMTSYTRIACGKIEWRENKRDFQDVHKCMTGISEKQIRWIDKYKKVKEIFYKIHFPWQNSLDCLVISVLKLLSTCLPRKSSISVTKAVCLRSTWGLEML